MKLSKENKQRIGFLLFAILFCVVLSLFDTSYHLKGTTTPQTTETTSKSVATTLKEIKTTTEQTTIEETTENQKYIGKFWCTSYCRWIINSSIQKGVHLMTTAFGVKVLLEILVALIIVYGFIHEDELIEFETVLKQYIKRRYNYAKRKSKESQK